MGKIIVSENVSLDGVVQDHPTGEEGFKHGGWFRYVVSGHFRRTPLDSG
jgi:hypothetical protein